MHAPPAHTDGGDTHARPKRWNRSVAVGLAALVLLSALLWLPRLRGPLDLRWDAGVYYVLGMSLAEGRGYRLLSEPGAIEAIQYPPLLSALTAAHIWMTGSAEPAVAGVAMRYTFAILFTLYIAAVFLVCLRYLPPWYAFLAGAITALHVQTVFLSDLVFAEIPFAFVTMLFFLAMARWKVGWRSWAAGGLLGAIAFGLRTAGLGLLVAWVAEGALRRRWRETAVRAALAVLPVLAWQLYTTGVANSAAYHDPAYPYQRAAYQFYNVGYAENAAYIDSFAPELGRITPAALARRIVGNTARMTTEWGGAVGTHARWWRGNVGRVNERIAPLGLPLWLAEVATALLTAGIVAGLVLLARRGEWLIPLYVAGSTGLIVLTPWPGQFARYLAPLTPVFALALLYAVREVRRVLSAARGGRYRRAATVAAAALITVILVQEGHALYKSFTAGHGLVAPVRAGASATGYRLFFYDESWAAHDAAIAWVREHARAGEITASSTPHWTFLQTGLESVMLPFEADPTEAQRLLDAVPAAYLLTDHLEFADVGQRYGVPVVQAFPERWELVYSAPTSDSVATRVYRRVPPQ